MTIRGRLTVQLIPRYLEDSAPLTLLFAKPELVAVFLVADDARLLALEVAAGRRPVGGAGGGRGGVRGSEQLRGGGGGRRGVSPTARYL